MAAHDAVESLPTIAWNSQWRDGAPDVAALPVPLHDTEQRVRGEDAT
jgi:hypothetical protein